MGTGCLIEGERLSGRWCDRQAVSVCESDCLLVYGGEHHEFTQSELISMIHPNIHFYRARRGLFYMTMGEKHHKVEKIVERGVSSLE